MSSSQMVQVNRLFVSYAHADNKLFDDAVAQFVDDLAGFFAAKTGNELKIFFDKKSIDWGDNWRSEIDGELRNASIFMPVITMQYFNRAACRDELNAYHSSASRLKAQYLILPIVISGSNSIKAGHSIVEVEIIEKLQYRNLEEAFLAGPGTREWRTALNSLTDELISAITKAEEESPGEPHSESSDPEEGDDDSGGILEVVGGLEAITPRIEGEIQTAVEDLEKWALAVQEEFGMFAPGKNAQEMYVASITMADKIREPSLALQKSASLLAATMIEVETLTSAFTQQVSRVRIADAKELAKKLSSPNSGGSSEFKQLIQQITEMLNFLTVFEALNSPLRKAIRPARIGITKFQDSAMIMDRLASLSLD